MSKISSPEKTQEYLERFIAGVKKRNPGEPEFHQAVHEVAHRIFPYIADKPHYHDMQIDERMAEPDRIIIFQGPLERISRNEDALVERVRDTVIHEVAHHFGISDERLDEIEAERHKER